MFCLQVVYGSSSRDFVFFYVCLFLLICFDSPLVPWLLGFSLEIDDLFFLCFVMEGNANAGELRRVTTSGPPSWASWLLTTAQQQRQCRRWQLGGTQQRLLPWRMVHAWIPGSMEVIYREIAKYTTGPQT
jgi:hypothetical protein